MNPEQGIATLQQRAKLLTTVLIVFIVADVALELVLVAALGGGMGQGLLFPMVAVRMLLFVVSVVAVCMWTYRANANLHDRGVEGLEFTPGWAVGWYFVPFANLFKPLHAMREIWRESMADDGSFASETPSLLSRWWACWIAGNILTNINERLLVNNDTAYIGVSLVCTLLSVGASIWLIDIVTKVTAAQSANRQFDHVFA